MARARRCWRHLATNRLLAALLALGVALAAPAQVEHAEVARALAESVRADAARRIGVAVTEVHILRVERHNWSDASLDCPEPERQYAQVVTPGYLILALAAGHTLEYHTDTAHAIVLCQRPAGGRHPA